MNEQLIHTEEKDGFTINFYVCEEIDSPEGHFASGDDDLDAQLCADIRNGKYEWFCAKVTASKEGIELGSDYLGGCCYETVMSFVEAGDYYPDMVETAISEARETLKKLAA